MTELTEKLLKMREKYLGVENVKNDLKDDFKLSRFCGEFKNVDKQSNPLKLMDVGFIIPDMCTYHEAIKSFYTYDNQNDFIETIHKSFIGLRRALCVYSSKSRKNLISKQKLSLDVAIYMQPIYTKPIGELEFPSGTIGPQKMYIWRGLSFKISGVMKSKNPWPVSGYELTILNEKMQIEERAFYVCLDEIEEGGN